MTAQYGTLHRNISMQLWWELSVHTNKNNKKSVLQNSTQHISKINHHIKALTKHKQTMHFCIYKAFMRKTSVLILLKTFPTLQAIILHKFTVTGNGNMDLQKLLFPPIVRLVVVQSWSGIRERQRYYDGEPDAYIRHIHSYS